MASDMLMCRLNPNHIFPKPPFRSDPKVYGYYEPNLLFPEQNDFISICPECYNTREEIEIILEVQAEQAQKLLAENGMPDIKAFEMTNKEPLLKHWKAAIYDYYEQKGSLTAFLNAQEEFKRLKLSIGLPKTVESLEYLLLKETIDIEQIALVIYLIAVEFKQEERTLSSLFKVFGKEPLETTMKVVEGELAEKLLTTVEQEVINQIKETEHNLRKWEFVIETYYRQQNRLEDFQVAQMRFASVLLLNDKITVQKTVRHLERLIWAHPLDTEKILRIIYFLSRDLQQSHKKISDLLEEHGKEDSAVSTLARLIKELWKPLFLKVMDRKAIVQKPKTEKDDVKELVRIFGNLPRIKKPEWQDPRYLMWVMQDSVELLVDLKQYNKGASKKLVEKYINPLVANMMRKHNYRVLLYWAVAVDEARLKKKWWFNHQNEEVENWIIQNYFMILAHVYIVLCVEKQKMLVGVLEEPLWINLPDTEANNIEDGIVMIRHFLMYGNFLSGKNPQRNFDLILAPNKDNWSSFKKRWDLETLLDFEEACAAFLNLPEGAIKDRPDYQNVLREAVMGEERRYSLAENLPGIIKINKHKYIEQVTILKKGNVILFKIVLKDKHEIYVTIDFEQGEGFSSLQIYAEELNLVKILGAVPENIVYMMATIYKDLLTAKEVTPKPQHKNNPTSPLKPKGKEPGAPSWVYIPRRITVKNEEQEIEFRTLMSAKETEAVERLRRFHALRGFTRRLVPLTRYGKQINPKPSKQALEAALKDGVPVPEGRTYVRGSDLDLVLERDELVMSLPHYLRTKQKD